MVNKALNEESPNKDTIKLLLSPIQVTEIIAKSLHSINELLDAI